MIAGLVLAAGGARRFGSQKLVALLDGRAVVQHVVATMRADVDAVWVVVGNEAESVRVALTGMDVACVDNADWALGLASSVKAGIRAIDATCEACEAVIVTVGDQPRLDRAVIQRVIARWRETATPIVSASYRGTRAHPVLFARELFGDLCALEGDAGARLLIERSGDRVAYVEIDAPMPRDIDTVADLRALEA